MFLALLVIPRAHRIGTLDKGRVEAAHAEGDSLFLSNQSA
jgi:hypothetical protein